MFDLSFIVALLVLAGPVVAIIALRQTA